MTAKVRVQAIPLSSFNGASLSASYQVLNSGGLDEACFFVRIFNDRDENVTLSLDGTNDHDIIPANSVLTFGFGDQSSLVPGKLNFAKGQVFYIKGTASAGNITLAGYYQI